MITATKTKPDMLRPALRLHSFGLSIFAVPIGRKKWLEPWEQYQTQRASVDQLRDWFGNGKPLQPVVIFGQVSGWLACRDFDRMASYNRWAVANPELAQQLPTVATPRPGRHVYFRDATATGEIITYDDGEFRGKGYCLVPPSRQQKGAYEWTVPISDDGDIPEVDPALAGLLASERATVFDASATQISGAGALAGRCDTEDTADPEDSGETGGLRRVNTTNNLYASSVSSESSVSHCDTETLIRRSLPSAAGQRHRKIFELARELKAVPSLAAAPAVSHRAIVQRWHELALPAISSKDFEDSWFDFLDAWDRVKKAKGESLIDDVVARAIASDVPEVAEKYSRKELRLLVAICRQLQRESKTGTFYLGCYTAAELLGLEDHQTTARWLRGLCAEGILKLITKGTLSKHRASEYRYEAPL